jgi:hypothetical protein
MANKTSLKIKLQECKSKEPMLKYNSAKPIKAAWQKGDVILSALIFCFFCIKTKEKKTNSIQPRQII